MIRLIPFLLFLFIGCTTIQQTEAPKELPELIRSAPLPPISSVVSGGGLRLNIRLLVLKDGTVGAVKLLEPSGDPKWDSLAVQSIKQWQFAAGHQNGVPVDTWIHQPIVVRLRDPIMRTLGELVSASRQEADSLYSLIEKGAEFESLVNRAGGAPSGTYRESAGAVDILTFPPHVRSQLEKLRKGQVTHPLRIGGAYVIYKRFNGGGNPAPL